MERYRDAVNARRAASDLLSWSMGKEPRNGFNYDREGYKTPKNPAMPERTAAGVVADVRGSVRYRALSALRSVLIWWLSFDDKEQKRQ
jgi:hypothetical protein